MAQSIKELTKKRDQADKLAEKWTKKTYDAMLRAAAYRSRAKRLTTIIEKKLAEQKLPQPSDPKRVVEV